MMVAVGHIGKQALPKAQKLFVIETIMIHVLGNWRSLDAFLAFFVFWIRLTGKTLLNYITKCCNLKNMKK